MVKPQQVEYWYSAPAEFVFCYCGDFLDWHMAQFPSNSVWIVPYENPWLMDWD